MVRYLCRGWVTDSIDEDRIVVVANSRQQKIESLHFIYDQPHEVSICSGLLSQASRVLSRADYMEKLDAAARAVMPLVCKQWAKMFLLRPDAPRWAADYNGILEKKHRFGLTTIYRDNTVLAQRCKCYLTDNTLAKNLIHYFQSKTTSNPPNLYPADKISREAMSEYLQQFSAEAVATAESVTIGLLSTLDVIVLE